MIFGYENSMKNPQNGPQQWETRTNANQIIIKAQSNLVHYNWLISHLSLSPSLALTLSVSLLTFIGLWHNWDDTQLGYTQTQMTTQWANVIGWRVYLSACQMSCLAFFFSLSICFNLSTCLSFYLCSLILGTVTARKAEFVMWTLVLDFVSFSSQTDAIACPVVGYGLKAGSMQ